MNNKPILRKWQYIAQRCRDKLWNISADVADEIDQVLCKCDYPEHTDAWTDAFSCGMVDEYTIHNLTKSSDFCTACVAENSCSTCDFKDRGGTKLYNRFRTDIKEQDELE